MHVVRLLNLKSDLVTLQFALASSNVIYNLRLWLIINQEKKK